VLPDSAIFYSWGFLGGGEFHGRKKKVGGTEEKGKLTKAFLSFVQLQFIEGGGEFSLFAGGVIKKGENSNGSWEGKEERSRE